MSSRNEAGRLGGSEHHEHEVLINDTSRPEVLDLIVHLAHPARGKRVLPIMRLEHEGTKQRRTIPSLCRGREWATFIAGIPDDVDVISFGFAFNLTVDEESQSAGGTVRRAFNRLTGSRVAGETEEAESIVRSVGGLWATTCVEAWTTWNSPRMLRWDEYLGIIARVGRRTVVTPFPSDRAAPLILVVEDEKNLRSLYKHDFEEDGYRVLTVGTAQAGLELFKTDPPALTVVDIRMPGMDGLAMMSRILEIAPSTPVVLNTAYSSYKDNFLSWAADAYVIKSGDTMELRKVVAQLLWATEEPTVSEVSAEVNDLKVTRRRLLGEISALRRNRRRLMRSESSISPASTASPTVSSLRSLLHDLNGTLIAAERVLGQAPQDDLVIQAALLCLAKSKALRGNLRSAILGDDIRATGSCVVASVFGDVAKAVANRERPKIEVTCQAGPAHRAGVCADDLFRVLFNLAENAREAIEREGLTKGTIRLIAKRLQGGPLRTEFLELSVEDTGPGFAAELVPAVFARPVSQKRPEGGGLGLPVSKDLVESWGGRIRLDSTHEGGGRLVLTVPAAESES